MSATFTSVTPENVLQESLFCIKDVKAIGSQKKQQWFEGQYEKGLRLKIAKDEKGKAIAFIEYTPARHAWRPVDADEFMFIHCMFVYAKKDREQGLGSQLVAEAEDDARQAGLKGLCTMSSHGSWVTDKRLFEQNGFEQVDKLGRFELMVKKFDRKAPNPQLINWEKQQAKYKGWQLVYADQCPWHEKSVQAISKAAKEAGINLQVKKLKSVQEAKAAPSGFGVFSLLKDGKLLGDHYISETRFRNILEKEL